MAHEDLPTSIGELGDWAPARTHSPQEIDVDPSAWRSTVASACPDVWAAFVDRRQVDRAWVRSFASGRPIDLLAASMIWGFGPVGYGPHRLGRMLTAENADVIAAEVVAGAQTGAKAGFRALFRNWRPRLPYLGVAFGTKLLAFATSPDEERSCYIYDKNVWKALVRLVPEQNFPDSGGPVRSDEYQRYCTWITTNGGTFGGGENLELALFKLGRKL